MKKYLLPSALILVGFLGLALAQNITKSLQISQAPNGPIGMDSSNNVYFPGHILSVGPATPAITSCGGGTPVIAGSDTAGLVTMGTSSTGCIVTFTRAYAATPWCVVTVQGGVSQLAYTTTTTLIQVSQLSTSSNKFNYFCSGAS